MITLTRSLSRVASGASTRAQKGALLLFGLMVLIISETDNLPKQISNFGITFENVDHFSILILTHYILIYILIAYIGNYIIDVILNWRQILFLPLTIIFDFFIPVGFSLYVFYRLDKKCDCILTSYDNFYSDLSSFFDWLNRFIPRVWKTLITFFEWIWMQITVNVINKLLLIFEEPIKYIAGKYIYIYDYTAPIYENITYHVRSFILYVPLTSWIIIITVLSIFSWIAKHTFELADISMEFWVASLFIFGISTAIMLLSFYIILLPKIYAYWMILNYNLGSH